MYPKHQGYTTLNSNLRGDLGGDKYWYLDLKNAHPSIIVGLNACDDGSQDYCRALRDYCRRRDTKHLKDLMDACRAYPGLSNSRRITFEYVMLKGINDSLRDAREMVELLAGIPAKINLIPFNPWPGTDYECSDWKTIEKFAAYLNDKGLTAPIRTPRGRDILAACGQLKSESKKASTKQELPLVEG